MSEDIRTNRQGFLVCQALAQRSLRPCADVAGWTRADPATLDARHGPDTYLVCDRHNAERFDKARKVA